MRNLFFVVVLMMGCCALQAQDVMKCDARVVRLEKAGSLTATEMSLFLMTLGEECRDTEFAETSNEFLFALLEKQTALTLNTLLKIETKVEKAYILDMLANPISNLINIKNVIAKIDKTNAGGPFREEVLKSLRVALRKG